MIVATAEAENEEIYRFIYGHVQVAYRVERKFVDAGKPRKISIQVTPDSNVTVRAPEDAGTSDIHDAVMKRAKWIVDSLQAFDAQKMYVQPRRYVSGEMMFYLGRRYVLKVEAVSNHAQGVKLTRGKLLVSLPEQLATNTDHIKAKVRQWYRKRAHHIFESRLNELLPQTRWVNQVPTFRILAMSKQWGSCSRQGTLMLNPHLVKAPRDCIDYVILHELCHIKEHNHSDRFYRLLTQQMPEWKQAKQQLDGMAELLLND